MAPARVGSGDSTIRDPGASVGDSAMLALEVRGRPLVMDQQPWHAS
jgi:hypothetical protein